MNFAKHHFKRYDIETKKELCLQFLYYETFFLSIFFLTKKLILIWKLVAEIHEIKIIAFFLVREQQTSSKKRMRAKIKNTN